jgi:hypothetical protein
MFVLFALWPRGRVFRDTYLKTPEEKEYHQQNHQIQPKSTRSPLFTTWCGSIPQDLSKLSPLSDVRTDETVKQETKKGTHKEVEKKYGICPVPSCWSVVNIVFASIETLPMHLEDGEREQLEEGDQLDIDTHPFPFRFLFLCRWSVVLRMCRIVYVIHTF